MAGEQQRMALMSKLLDPLECAAIDRLGIGPGWRCMEFGSGNGSIAQALAKRVGPTGHVVASDIDTAYIEKLQAPNLEVRRIDLVNDEIPDEIEEGTCDLVVARALLQRLTPALKALERMVAALKPGGVLLSIEPDMLPSTVTEPDSMRTFWQGWLNWSVDAGMDYFIGRKVPAWLDGLDLTDIAGEGHTAQFNGNSEWASYWLQATDELAPAMLGSYITEPLLDEFRARYNDPHYWTSVITFIANWGRKPA